MWPVCERGPHLMIRWFGISVLYITNPFTGFHFQFPSLMVPCEGSRDCAWLCAGSSSTATNFTFPHWTSAGEQENGNVWKSIWELISLSPCCHALVDFQQKVYLKQRVSLHIFILPKTDEQIFINIWKPWANRKGWVAVTEGSDTEQPEPSCNFCALVRESSALRFQLHLTPEFQSVGFSNYFTKKETLACSISPGKPQLELFLCISERLPGDGALHPLHIATEHQPRASSSSLSSSQADPKPPSTQDQPLAATCQQIKQKELLLMLLITTTWCRWALRLLAAGMGCIAPAKRCLQLVGEVQKL